MQFRFAAFQQRHIDPANGTGLTRIDRKWLRQESGEQSGIAFDLFAQTGIKHLHHIDHAGGLVMQIFDGKIFKLLAGFMAEQKSEKQKQNGDTHTGQQR